MFKRAVPRRHWREIVGFVRRGDVCESDGGALIHGCIRPLGVYRTTVRGRDESVDFNLTPTQGLGYLLGLLGSTAKETGFYLAPFSGAVTPAANWTAANFAANATEIVSTTEGFSNATRPAWTPDVPGNYTVGGTEYYGQSNAASPGVLNTLCSSTVNVSGMALLSSSVRGGTGGILLSVMRYDSVRVVNNGDPIEVSYLFTMTDS